MITNKVIPTLISHLDAYIEGGRRIRGNTSLESAVIQYLKTGDALHKAVNSREDESAYLKATMTALMPYLLPAKYLTSKLVF